MAFDERFIAELKLRNPITELVGQYAQLKRAGSNTVCCCPFHSEKTPSFTIFSDDHFYCFGCGAGGDAITFMMKIENLDYVSAVERLAQRCGMTVPQDGNRGPKVDTKRLFDMNASAARFYYEKMVSPEGAYARDYLAGRGFDLTKLKKFGLGFADGRTKRDELSAHLLAQGYTPREMKTMFLAGTDKNGRMFDYFRNRVVFPVIDVSGRVIAFSGRFIGTPGENDRKYFNTSDTPVYKKSRNLYGLNIAKNAKKNWLILCEGNMDAVALQAAGFENAVAGLGTALTPDQARLIKRYAETAYLCYDSDEAGQRAADKAMRLLGDAGVGVKVLKMEGAKDPDEFLRKFGKNAFEKLVEKAAGQSEYKFALQKEKFDLTNMDGRKAFIQAVLNDLVPASALEAQIYLAKLSEVTEVSREVLEKELAVRRRKWLEKRNSDRIAADERSAAGYRPPPDQTRLSFASASAPEDNAVGILLLRPEYLLDAKIREKLDPEIFTGDLHRRAVKRMLELTSGGAVFDTGMMGESFTADEMGALTGFRIKRSRLEDNSPGLLEEILDKIKEKTEKNARTESPEDLDDWISGLREKKKGK